MTLSNTFRPIALGVLASVALFMFSLQAHSLPDDNQQPITLQSDQAEFDRANGTTTYSGSVVMEQGSMKIEADKIVIHGDMKQVTHIIATGQPAQFQQTPELGESPVVATGNTLEYQIEDKVLYLLKNATLSQEGSLLSGTRITYDVEKSVVQAGETAVTNPEERVKMIIPPIANDEE